VISKASKEHIARRVRQLRGEGHQTAGVYTAVKGISSYAFTNAYELVAEAFADVMIHGLDRADPLSVSIYEEMVDVYRSKYE